MLPPLLDVAEIRRRLQLIFPEGTPNRANCTWEIAARTLFVMLYVGAIEGGGVWLRPDQVTRMTNAQASRRDQKNRSQWAQISMSSSKGEIRGRWYAVNTRESIRDDTLRSGLIPNGAVIERQGMPTTSPAARYAIKKGFAALFDPAVRKAELTAAITAWQADNLTAGALARIAITRKGAVAGGQRVMVTFPNGETRRMTPGPSSIISKAVVEEFAIRFLEKPGVIFLSESGNKIVARDDDLARSIGLQIRAEKNLPDIVLVDLGPKHPLLVFVEVVATDGAVTEDRKKALLQLAEEAGFAASHVGFVTAYLDRGEAAFRRTAERLAWNTFVWFASEPEGLVVFRHGEGKPTRRLSAWR